MNALAKKLSDSVKSRGHDESGCDCSYYRITPKWGLKLYSNSRMAKTSCEKQKFLHNMGIAPNCLGVRQFKIGLSKQWGFLTEHFEAYINTAECKKINEENELGVWSLVCEPLCEKVEQEYGINWPDCHAGNFHLDGDFFCLIDTLDVDVPGFNEYYEDKHGVMPYRW